jgi:hypothetical protein
MSEGALDDEHRLGSLRVFGVLATGFSILIGSVIAVMAARLLILRGLDQPFHDGVGGLLPQPCGGRCGWPSRRCARSAPK